MFGKNKRQKELERTLEEIKLEREKLEKLKEELLTINKMMTDTNTPDLIDISNVYIWEVAGVRNIVKLNVREFIGRHTLSGRQMPGYESTVIDIFTNKEIYSKCALNKIERKEYLGDGEYAILYPIYEADRSLLAYPNKRVPRHVLYQAYYKINNVEIPSKEFQKIK